VATSQVERYTDRQQRRTVVVWGCSTHRTPRDEVCRGCLDQGNLFGRSDVRATAELEEAVNPGVHHGSRSVRGRAILGLNQ
jgi:hypothetical protein